MLGAGGRSTLASLRGKVVVLNFWASWCEPCQVEAPMLEHAQRSLERHDATVLGVTYQDDSPDSESFVRRYHLTYPILRDATGEFAHSFGTRQVPESFIINRQGRIVAISRGEIEQALRQAARSRSRRAREALAGRASPRRCSVAARCALAAAARGARGSPAGAAAAPREPRVSLRADRTPGDVRDVQSRAR